MTDDADTTSYFAADFARDAERSRLSILEHTLDSITIGHLERLAFAGGATAPSVPRDGRRRRVDRPLAG